MRITTKFIDLGKIGTSKPKEKRCPINGYLCYYSDGTKCLSREKCKGENVTLILRDRYRSLNELK